MRKRRNQIEVIEDSFNELTAEDQGKVLAVLSALARQKQRQGAALSDLPKKRPAKQPDSQTALPSMDAGAVQDAIDKVQA